MREILPRRLWIGNAGDARDVRRALDAGITAIVDLAAEESPAHPSRDLIYCRFPMVDGAGNEPRLLRTTVSTVVSFLKNEYPTLICCGAGMSRAPAIAAASLALHHHEDPRLWLEKIIHGQPHDVAPSLWLDLTSACFTQDADADVTD